MSKQTPQTLADYFAQTGRTLADVAEVVGIGVPMMSLIVRGLRQPSLDVALRIEKETGVPVESFARRIA